MLCNTTTRLDGLDALSAIADGRMQCAYQPVRNTELSGTALYSEALARLVTLTGKIRGPGMFVPQLEASGDIALLDEHMVGLILDDLGRRPDAVLGCNLSAETMQSAEAWRRIYDKIASRRHLAPRLVLEITETCPVKDIGHLNMIVAETRKLGCRVAVDDFGSGYLSPAQLLQLDVDIVKIDASLLWAVKGCPQGANTLRHMVGFASCVAPIVIVEGVESPEHLAIARAAGATHVQGYLVAMPMPSGAIGALEAA